MRIWSGIPKVTFQDLFILWTKGGKILPLCVLYLFHNLEIFTVKYVSVWQVVQIDAWPHSLSGVGFKVLESKERSNLDPKTSSIYNPQGERHFVSYTGKYFPAWHWVRKDTLKAKKTLAVSTESSLWVEMFVEIYTDTLLVKLCWLLLEDSLILCPYSFCSRPYFRTEVLLQHRCSQVFSNPCAINHQSW